MSAKSEGPMTTGTTHDWIAADSMIMASAPMMLGPPYAGAETVVRQTRHAISTTVSGSGKRG